MWSTFWLFASLPHIKKWKNVNLYREKVYKKAWKSAHIGFWVCCTMSQALSDMYFLSYDGFSWFLTGRLRHRVWNMQCRGRIRPKEDCCIVPFHFAWFLTPLYATCILKFGFFRNYFIVETWNLHHWIWHASNPKYTPLKPIWCIFASQNQQSVIFLPQIFIFQEATYCRDLTTVPLDLACLKP